METKYNDEITLKYMNKEAKICIDMDNSAESYLKRGISKEEFFEFVYQVVEMMDRCNKYNLYAEFDLDKVAVEGKNVYFRTCIGNCNFDINFIKQYLKYIAYTSVFRGDDFLKTLYEYLSFLDLEQTQTLTDIKNQINNWVNTDVQITNNQVAFNETATADNNKTVNQIQQEFENNTTYEQMQTGYENNTMYSQQMQTGYENNTMYSQQMQTGYENNTMYSQQVQAGYDNYNMYTQSQTGYENGAASQEGMYGFGNETELEEDYSTGAETGVLDPSFWNKMMGKVNGSNDSVRVSRKSSMANLVNIKTKQNISINKEKFTIGKGSDSDFVLDNSSISRNHAEIVFNNNHFYVIDKGSTNGTYINGRLISSNAPTEINNGELLRFSTEEYKFYVM